MRLQPASGVKEKRLAALLAGRRVSPADPRLRDVVADAQLLGSLELAGVDAGWDAVRRSRIDGSGPPEVLALRRAQSAVAPRAPLSVQAIRTWHEALAGPVGFRKSERAREDAPTTPPEWIGSRLATLEEWLSSAGLRDLAPEQAAALAYARIVEVLPFEEGNGRVARLAASHVLVQRGRRPPILVKADAPYLLACLRAAFRLDTGPLVSLLAEAETRALDVMVQALERGEV